MNPKSPARAAALFASLAMLIAPRTAAAQSTDGASRPAAAMAASVVSRDAEGTPTIRAFRTTGPVRVDGVLDEPQYCEVQPATDLLQHVLEPGAPATEKTEVWIL